jgi:hypothetical protein
MRLPVCEPLAFGALNRALASYNIVNAKRNTVRITEVEFAQIAMQVLFVAVLIDAFHASFASTLWSSVDTRAYPYFMVTYARHLCTKKALLNQDVNSCRAAAPTMRSAGRDFAAAEGGIWVGICRDEVLCTSAAFGWNEKHVNE